MNQPLLIVVTGRPGSGKTTLAHKLAQEIRCPCLCRDEFKEGLVNTARKNNRDVASSCRAISRSPPMGDALAAERVLQAQLRRPGHSPSRAQAA